MLVLDACVGSEKIYKGKNKRLGENFISIDKRKGDFSHKTRAALAITPIIIKPIVLADMKYLPFKNKIIDVIICDPPHLNCGKTSFMGKAYGSWNNGEFVSIIYKANIEFSRVLKDNGTLILKILPDMIDRYENLLSNFCFYLPIQTIRDWGCITSKESKLAAVWLIGIKKDE